MDPEDINQDQESNDTQSSESDDRHSPQNPSQNNRGEKKAAKKEVKDNKKNNVDSKDQKAQGDQDPLNKQEKKDKNIGHVPKMGNYKALREAKRGQRKEAAKTVAKNQIKKKIKQAAKKAAKKAIKKAITAAAENPYVVGAIAIIILIIIIIITIMGGPAGADENALVLTKTGPTEAKDAGELLLYRITASYPGTAQDVTVTDHLPEGTDFDPSTPPPAHYDPATRTVSWSVKEVVPPVNGLISNINTTFALNLRATAGNIIIVNQADGAVIGEVITPKSPVGGGGPTPEGYIPPNDDSCGGRYALTGNRFLPKNFGNPTCMSDAELKDAVYKQLQKDDAANADWWYFQVLACESGYNPNAWLDPDTLVEGYRSPDAGGAWGLFQDGSSANFPDRLYSSNRTESVTLDKASELPGRPPPAVGHSKDPADRGDLNWSIQIKNAVELLKGRGRGYWACA